MPLARIAPVKGASASWLSTSNRVREEAPGGPAQDRRDLQALGRDRLLDGGHEVVRQALLEGAPRGGLVAREHHPQGGEHGRVEEEDEQQRARAQRVPHGWLSVLMIFISGRNSAITMKPTKMAITIRSAGSSTLKKASILRVTWFS